MKINRQSWHYKFMMNFWRAEEPSNLCQYFWRLIGYILITPIFAVFLPVALLMFQFIYLYEKFGEWYYHCRPDDYAIVSFFKSKKIKACPLIEYYDSKKT